MRSYRSLIAPLILFAAGAGAFGQVSFNGTLTSDYVWRGVSQSQEDPAIQGGLDYNAESGFYIGAWGSSIDFNDDNQVEVDAYLGFSQELESMFSYDLGYIYYAYDDDSDLDFGEVFLGLGYKAFSVKYSYDTENDNGYLEGGLDFDLAETWALSLHAGESRFDGGGSYTDYKVALTKTLGHFEFEAAYWDTDLDFGLADGRGVLSITYSR